MINVNGQAMTFGKQIGEAMRIISCMDRQDFQHAFLSESDGRYFADKFFREFKGDVAAFIGYLDSYRLEQLGTFVENRIVQRLANESLKGAKL